MKKQMKINLCIIGLIVGITIFVLQLFVFESPNGILGFLLCLTSIYLIIGSLVGMCKLDSSIKNRVLAILDMLFFIR